jgi:hypothetical protein
MSSAASSGVGVPVAELRRRWRDVVWWLPILLAGIYGLVVLAEFRGITAHLYTNSDFALAPVIAHLLGDTPAGTRVIIGDFRWYEPLTYLWATRWLPLHRQLWDVTPLVCDLGGVGLLAWSTRRTFGRWPAAVSAAALICVGQGGLQALTYTSHAPGIVHTIVLGAALVWLASRDRLISWRALAAGSLGLGLFTAAAVPDRLFLVWGVVPFVATAALVAWRATGPASRRLLGFALLSAAVALVAAGVFDRVMSRSGVGTSAFPITFTAADALGSHIVLMLQGLTDVAGGDFFGLPLDFTAIATFLTGGIVLAAVVFVSVDVRRRVALAGPRAPSAEPAELARLAYVSFWSICLVSTLVTFTFVDAAGNVGAARYLLGAYVAVAALVPLLTERGLGFRLSVAAAVSLLAALATFQLLRVPVNPQNASPSTSDENALVRFAGAHRLRYGYAGYWDSMPFSWASDFAVEVFPVVECGETGLTLCPFSLDHVSSWYAPRARTPTFLIVDPAVPFPVTAPDPALGKPVFSTTIGQLRIYVYPYDIASRLGRQYSP